jgi:hypothetical protein
MQELKKIEQRKKEREKKTLDLQKLITAADSNAEARRPERKATKKMIVCKVKDTSVRLLYIFHSFFICCYCFLCCSNSTLEPLFFSLLEL